MTDQHNAIAWTAKQQELKRLASGKAKHILGVGGSRSGKTFAFCAFVDVRARKAPGSRHLILRRHAVSTKTSIGMDTMPKVHELSGWRPKPRYDKQLGVFTYPDGSEIWLSGLDDNNLDKILGKEYVTIYFNEASEYGFGVFEQVMTRLAQKVEQADGRHLPLKCYADLNPTTFQHWTYQLWFAGTNPASRRSTDPDDYVSLFMNPRDNEENLPSGFISSLEELSDAQRKRFLLGQYASDDPYALWRRDMIQHVEEAPSELDRIVVAVDPATSTSIGSNETGIVAAGVEGPRGKRKGYVLEDASGALRPEEWARTALALYHGFNADAIVAEKNQGGDMVEAVIRAAEAQSEQHRNPARVILVTATRGKAVRAEPIAGLYERGLVFHVGGMDALEDQLCMFTSDFDRQSAGYSPDRLDATVWALTELFGQIATRRPTTTGTHVADSGFNPLGDAVRGRRSVVAHVPGGWGGLG